MIRSKIELLIKECINENIEDEIKRLDAEWNRLDSMGNMDAKQKEIARQIQILQHKKNKGFLTPDSPKAKELMAKLKQSIQEKLLKEDYNVSNDSEKILYDFYVLSYLSTLNLDVTAKNANVSFFGDIEEYTSLIEDAENKLLPYLKNEMLSAVFYSLCCEIRYINSSDTDVDILHTTYKQYPFINSYRKYINSYYGEVEREKSYKKIISLVGDNNANFVQAAKFIFENWAWEEAYGGQAWANICDGWLRLYNSSNKKDLYVSIDHLYDLEHNTGSVFNKLEKYLKKGTTDWLRNALNLKAKIKSIHTVLPLCSSDMKKIALQVLKKANIKPASGDIKIKVPEPKKPKYKLVIVKTIETLEDFLSFEPELTKKGVVVIYDGEPKEGQHQITVKNINKYSMLQFRYRIIEPKNDKKLFMVQNYKDGKKVVDSKNYLNISDLYKGLVEEILNDVKFYF
jgi:hypothetical protein